MAWKITSSGILAGLALFSTGCSKGDSAANYCAGACDPTPVVSEPDDGSDQANPDAGGMVDTGRDPSWPLDFIPPLECDPDTSSYGSPAATPRVSLDAAVAASEGVINPEGLVDGDYHKSGGQTNFGQPTEDEPQWVAIDVGEGPTSLLALWTDPGYLVYSSTSGGAPDSYRIEVSGDSTDGEDGEWEVVVDVTGNPVRSRAHSFGFEGMRWVRFVALGAPDPEDSVLLDELALHDLSEAEGVSSDTWFFMGDSITQGAFKRDLAEATMFDELVAADAEDRFPVLIAGGIGGELVSDALARIDEALEMNPEIRYFALAYGTNDAWGNTLANTNYEDQLVELVERVLDAGHVPVIPYIPYASGVHSGLPDFNQVIHQIQEEYELPCGPDLYTWFGENGQELGDDGVHPTQEGYRSINRLWAEAALRMYAAE